MTARKSRFVLIVAAVLSGAAFVITKMAFTYCSKASDELVVTGKDDATQGVATTTPTYVPDEQREVRAADLHPSTTDQSGKSLSQQFQASTSTAGNKSSETIDGLTKSLRIRQVIAFPLNALAMLKRDCPGSMVADCDQLLGLAKSVVEDRGTSEDGWSEWMESQIQASLVSAPPPDNRSSVAVRCSREACVFFVSAESVNHIFGTGLGDSADTFKRWLVASRWADELAINNRKVGDPSILAWEIFGWDDKPFVIWYVVRRKA